MTVDKYRHWVVSLYENVDDDDDDDEQQYSHYGYHHYLGFYPWYGGNVLDISIDPEGYVYVCMHLRPQIIIIVCQFYCVVDAYWDVPLFVLLLQIYMASNCLQVLCAFCI